MGATKMTQAHTIRHTKIKRMGIKESSAKGLNYRYRVIDTRDDTILADVMLTQKTKYTYTSFNCNEDDWYIHLDTFGVSMPLDLQATPIVNQSPKGIRNALLTTVVNVMNATHIEE